MTNQDFDAWLLDPGRRPLVMGVLNVTPDSFSDGARYADPRLAADHARAMADAGADLIDVGGESTRPGSERTGAGEQIRRILPVFESLSGKVPAVLSVDTTRSEVARSAIDHGAYLINDISAATDDPAMLPLAAGRGVPIVLMHMQGQPATMQLNPTYADVVSEVVAHLQDRVAAAVGVGVPPHRILLDPGIGFGKTLDHNLALLRNLDRFAALNHPLLLGVSRKGFIGRLTGENEPSQRLFGTAAAVAWCVANHAHVVRVHDVEQMSKVVKVIDAIRRAAPASR
jgi:dihydropteroate synthase